MTPTIRALIVDDERLARTRVVTLLEPHDDIHIAGECKNGTEAIEFINTNKPDLIFLDVQMPDMDGFAVLAHADLSYDPFVIFATAYDRYAIQAFDVHAVDYLLKPFDTERFDASLERARQQLRLRESSAFSQKLVGLVREHQGLPRDTAEVFEVRERGRVYTVNAADVYWFQADGNYLTIHLADRSYLHRMTMNDMAAALDPARFLRVHRSTIVNIVHVTDVRYLNRNNEFGFIFRDGRRVVSARSYRNSITEFLKHTRFLQK
jgi:two-component system LytT family response regulator